jgi:Ca2+-binding RTX toxin-like protein
VQKVEEDDAMTDFTGTTGDDVFAGGGDNDNFDMTQGGRDDVDGAGGNDTFSFGAALRASDKIEGGDGQDVLFLSGDYSFGLVFNAQTMKNVETLSLGAGHSYNLTLRDGNIAGSFTVSAATLGAGESLILDASADTDAAIGVHSGAGDDVITTGAGNDGITLGLGNDTVYAGAGINTFQFNTNSFDAGDALFGGAGTDFVGIIGDYSGGLTITKDMIDSIDVFFIGGDFSYDLTFANKANDGFIGINATGVSAGFDVVIDAAAEKTASFSLLGSVNDDELIGGSGGDAFIDSGNAGNDLVKGKGGDDTVTYTSTFTKKDKFDGGDGSDELNLNGDYSGGVTFKAATIERVEAIDLAAGNDYTLVLHDGNIAAGETLAVSALLGSGNVLVLDATAELDGAINATGGDGNDTVLGGAGNDTVSGDDGDDVVDAGNGLNILTGGAGDDDLSGGNDADVLTGGEGADRLEGDNGADKFVYGVVSESTGTGHDTIVTFNVNVDKFDLLASVGGVNAAVTSGSLSAATFDADLAAAINVATLAAGNAVVFIPDTGDLAGRMYVVIERAGGAGYQAGLDIVVEVETSGNLTSLSTANFI